MTIKTPFDEVMDEVAEQIKNHPNFGDKEFKTSGYAMMQSMRTGEPLALQNVRTGESSEKLSEADAMLAEDLGDRIVDTLGDNCLDNRARSFRVHFAALEHAFRRAADAHDPNNTMYLAMPAGTSPNVRKIADQIMHATSNNGEVFPHNNALACIIVAAGWLACVDDTKHADEITSNLSDIVTDLVQQNRGVGCAEFERDTGATVDLYTGKIVEATPPSEH